MDMSTINNWAKFWLVDFNFKGFIYGRVQENRQSHLPTTLRQLSLEIFWLGVSPSLSLSRSLSLTCYVWFYFPKYISHSYPCVISRALGDDFHTSVSLTIRSYISLYIIVYSMLPGNP